MLLPKSERLHLIYERLSNAPAVNTRPEALDLIQRVFREVEDAHSGVPDLPDHPDRMHPPIEAMEEDMAGSMSAKRYRHKRHCTIIADNGAFEMRSFIYAMEEGKKRRIGERIEFFKLGADGAGAPCAKP